MRAKYLQDPPELCLLTTTHNRGKLESLDLVQTKPLFVFKTRLM